jgi:hypothetical protein
MDLVQRGSSQKVITGKDNCSGGGKSRVDTLYRSCDAGQGIFSFGLCQKMIIRNCVSHFLNLVTDGVLVDFVVTANILSGSYSIIAHS